MTIVVQDFRERMEDKQSVYKTEVLGVKQMGWWRDDPYPHILPEDSWSLNLWEEISYKAIQYFAQSEIAWHTQKNNMLSSQVMLVNIFFPLKQHLDLLKPWLSRYYSDVKNVTDLDFEYIGPKNRNYFNERGGRGQNRTSSDISIVWEDKDKGRNMLLLEYKFTEPNFGECSQENNPNRQRCFSSRRVVFSPHTQCHKAQVGRTYWDRVLSEDTPFHRKQLVAAHYCPFRYDFYQLMRNQLLAHCIESDHAAGFNRVDFGVMYHADGDKLLRMSHPFGGERDPLRAWSNLLKNPEIFHAFTVQDFLDAIDKGLPDDLAGWRTYLKQRYGV